MRRGPDKKEEPYAVLAMEDHEGGGALVNFERGKAGNDAYPGAITSDSEIEADAGERNATPPHVVHPDNKAQLLKEDQGVQLEQVQELQAKLDKERERLRLLQQTLEWEHVVRARGGGARERARDVNHRIIEDKAGKPPVFNRASQNVVAATMLLYNMPEPSTPEAR
jgi:hypothetical protein